MSRPYITIVLMSGALLVIPLAAASEDVAISMWNNRLYQPIYLDEAMRHTPQITAGTFLPPTLTESRTYTAADNPLLLTHATEIPAGVTITLEPGVRVLAHEFATLHVNGTLNAAGTEQEPIVFTTNEVHPENQNWNGLSIAPGGRSVLNQTHIEYASPALSCLTKSVVEAQNLETRFGLVGVYTESATCTITNSRLQALQYGVVARGTQPNVTTLHITAGKSDTYVRSF